MSKTAIVKSGENFFIKQLSKSQPIKLDRVIFANVPGINSNTDINADEKMPASNQIVHTAPVTQSGLLNDRTVVYSVILDTGVGDFSFNYIGLVNAETNTLCLVMHTDLTKKIKTAAQRQGNTITESIWLEIDNASESTGVSVNAKTWQIDYSKRLAGEDERIRLTNYDLYNRIAINDGLDITKQNNQLIVSPGIVYIAGLRVKLLEVININVENNQSLYVDAWLAGTITGEWSVKFNLIAGTNLHDYHDGNFQHYVERIASVDNAGNLIKVNPRSFVTTFDLASLTKPGIVKLSSAIDSTSETEAATPLAVRIVNEKTDNAHYRISQVHDFSIDVNNRVKLVKERLLPVGIPQPWPSDHLPAGWLECNGSPFDVNQFPKLAAVYPWGTLPDLRGLFIRGKDNGRGLDPNRGILSYQDDAIRNIYGEMGFYEMSECVTTSGAFHISSNPYAPTTFRIRGDGSNPVVRFDASRIVPTANENRPRNVAFIYIVKAE